MIHESAYHNAVRVHDSVETMSYGHDSAVCKMSTQCLLNDSIRPACRQVGKQEVT